MNAFTSAPKTSAVLLALLPALAGAQVTLRYACTDGAESLPIVQRVIAEFEAAHPGVRIKAEPVVDNYKNKLLAMTAANVAPDVARMGLQDWRSFAARRVLLPLDPYVKRDGVRLDEWYANTIEYSSMDGKLFVLPRSVAPTGLLFYNRRLFREAGLADPKPDWTWDYAPRPALGSACFTNCMERLTKFAPAAPGKRSKALQWGAATAWPQLWFETLLLSRGLAMWDDDREPTRLTVTDPEVLRLFRFAADTIHKERWLPNFSELGTANTNAFDQFIQGKIAMYQSGAWEIKKLRAQMRDDWDVAPFPAFVGQPLRSPGEGNGTAIFASTKHPDEAWEFVRWMSGPEGQRAFARAGADQPAMKSIARSADWLGDGAAAPRSLAVTDRLAAAVTLRQTPEWFADVANSCQGSSYDVLTGVKTPEETMRNLKDRGERAMALAKRQTNDPPYPFGLALTAGIAIFLGLVAWVYLPERGRRLTRTERGENRSAYLFLLPWIAGFLLTVGPMIYSLLLSLSDSDIIQPPRWRGLANYADALNYAQDDTLWVSLRVTAVYAAISIPLGIATALALAVLLNQKVRGVPLWRALYYVPSLASGVAVSLVWMKVFNPETGLLNGVVYGPDGTRDLLGLGTLLSNLAGTPGKPIDWLGNPKTVLPAFVIMGLWGAGGGTVIFLAGLQGISPTYHEAATLDGAGPVRRFWRVTLPLLTPTLFFSLITGVIGALQAFTQAYVITDGGPDRATMFTMLHLYKKAFGELKMGYASALAWILFVIILLLTVIQLRGSRRWVHYEGDLR